VKVTSCLVLTEAVKQRDLTRHLTAPRVGEFEVATSGGIWVAIRVLCMLAYYVEWHMREAWRELMFSDEDQAAKLIRDPVAPAQRSDEAIKKVQSRTLSDGSPVHSFQTLMATHAGIVRNTCRTPSGGADAPTFVITTTPNPQQKRALELIGQIKM
jgi:hypothetical protein